MICSMVEESKLGLTNRDMREIMPMAASTELAAINGMMARNTQEIGGRTKSVVLVCTHG